MTIFFKPTGLIKIPFIESLILVDERWRRALHMQVEREYDRSIWLFFSADGVSNGEQPALRRGQQLKRC